MKAGNKVLLRKIESFGCCKYVNIVTTITEVYYEAIESGCKFVIQVDYNGGLWVKVKDVVLISSK